MNARERYIEGLKTVSLDELLTELAHSAKKTGQYEVFSEHWEVAKDEVEIIREEITRRFNANDF